MLAHLGRGGAQYCGYVPDDKDTVGFHYARGGVSSEYVDLRGSRRRKRGRATYLIAQNRDTNVAFLVDSGVVDLCRESHLIHKSPTRVSTVENRSKGACSTVDGLLTEGALKGKFSGRERLKKNVPPLYGLLDCVWPAKMALDDNVKECEFVRTYRSLD